MNLSYDLKHAWRLLMKSKGYSLMCVAVVALSVGLAVWTCELVYSQVLKPLAFPTSGSWYSVQMAAKAASTPVPAVDAYTYQELLKRSRSADHIGAFAISPAVLNEGQASTRLRGAAISPSLLSSMQRPPLKGRVFEGRDAQDGADSVAILSYDAWQRYFAGSADIIGRTTRLNGSPVQIIGVMPQEFLVFQDFEIWTPLKLPALARPSDSSLIVSPFIKLADKNKLGGVLSEMKGVVDSVNHDYPDLFDAKRRVAIFPAHQMYTHAFAPIVTMVSLIALAVLVIGGVNISMVFLAWLLERSRELALRNALGATRGRLMRQCLLETALIVLAGMIGGYGFAWLGVRWTQGLSDFGRRVKATGRSTNLLELRPADLVAAIVCAVLIWLISTLIPAWRITKQDSATALAGSGKGTSSRGGNKGVALLVAVQVVVSCIVLVVCVNLVLAVKQEVSKANGLNSAAVTIATDPTVFDSRYSEPSARLRYWEDLQTAIRAKVPGAQVAFTTGIPTSPQRVPATVETQQSSAAKDALKLPVAAVSDDYFSLLGVVLRSGRLLDTTDNNTSLNVAVIDEKLAKRYWPDEQAIGKRIQLNPTDNGPWLSIVGVVSHVTDGPYGTDQGVVYRPLRQAIPSEFRLLVRAPNRGADVRDAVRSAAFTVDRDLPLQNLQTLDDYIASLNIATTMLVPGITAIALIVALLAASGLFGLISRSVAQRTQEVGIRRALGATPMKATARFTRQGTIYLFLALVGLSLGVMVMPLLSRSISNILDHVLLGTLGVVVLMIGVIFTASYLPSRRAVSLEPGDALRYE